MTQQMRVPASTLPKDKPIIFAAARIISGDPVVGTIERGDVLLGGDTIVGVGPGLTSAAGDDDAFVIDCSAMTVVPVVSNLLFRSGHSLTRVGPTGAIAPGEPATFGIVAGNIASPADSLDVPHDFVAVLESGQPIAWNGVWQIEAATPSTQRNPANAVEPTRVGVWVDETGFLEQELRNDGRYDETRGGRPHAFQGTYWIDGDRVDYLDDLGFWAYGKFTNDVLDHAGYRMRLRTSR